MLKNSLLKPKTVLDIFFISLEPNTILLTNLDVFDTDRFTIVFCCYMYRVPDPAAIPIKRNYPPKHQN